MDKKLVIVESPAKAKSINKILGGGYEVKASMGHVRDLPRKKFGVNLQRGFKPEYEVVFGREKVVKELRASAKNCAAIYLAPDPDREGEAIAWHLQALLEGAVPADKFFRVTYNEITPRAVREAFAHPRGIDQHKVDAQQARRVLDRIVGYKVSPLLWSRIKGGLSAGRVQSVALRLICEREAAIRAFVPQAFWLIGAVVRKLVDPRDPFRIRLMKIDDAKPQVLSQEQADAILRDVENRTLRVSKINRRETQRRPFPPFITSSLQQAGSRVFDFPPSRTMKIAQRLYEGVDLGDGPLGLITYMRTDSFSVSQDAAQACRAFIAAQFGQQFLPEQPHVFRSRASAQEAHEAIRPTDVNLTPDKIAGRLAPDELKLYRLIWQRFVASQMAAARIGQLLIDIDALPQAGVPFAEKTVSYLFRVSSSEVLFPGYMQVAGADLKVKEKEGEGEEEAPEVEKLPPLQEGEILERIEWLSERKETQPPNRYSEGTLVKTLEENGVGRPSTYAQILSTLQDRSYVIKEQRALRPTSLGEQVCTLLVANLNELFDVQFTARMELLLDEVESGKVAWTAMLADFYGRFQGWMKLTRGPDANPDHVTKILDLLSGVADWLPGIQRGKTTFSDQKFVESVRKQIEVKHKALTERQLQALIRVSLRYKEQIAGIEEELHAMGFSEAVATGSANNVTDVVAARKLDLLKNTVCTPPSESRGRKFDDRAFIDSLAEQAAAHRSLSPAQCAVIDRLLVKYASQIPDFENVSREFGLDLSKAVDRAPTEECRAVMDAIGHVKEWNKPRKHGRRIIDDNKFYVSLRSQFDARHSLSIKQLGAARRMLMRYHAQVPGYDELAARLNLQASARPPRYARNPVVEQGNQPDGSLLTP